MALLASYWWVHMAHTLIIHSHKPRSNRPTESAQYVHILLILYCDDAETYNLRTFYDSNVDI